MLSKRAVRVQFGVRWIVLILLLGGCSGNAPAADRFQLVCESWSRADTTQPLAHEQRFELLIQIPKGPVPAIALKPNVIKAKHPDFHIILSNDRGSVLLDVIDAHTGKQIHRTLWQFSGVPKNIFPGQGFTGLLYFIHPDTGSELQMICRSAKAGKKNGGGQ